MRILPLEFGHRASRVMGLRCLRLSNFTAALFLVLAGWGQASIRFQHEINWRDRFAPGRNCERSPDRMHLDFGGQVVLSRRHSV
jgi:hypothetical protein